MSASLLHHSDKKAGRGANVLSCDKAASTSANELSRQWVVRPSTTHRLEIRRALYLLPSNKKDGCGANDGCVLSCDSNASIKAPNGKYT